MQPYSPFTNMRLTAAMALIIVTLSTSYTQAWCVYNFTRYSLNCQVYGGDWNVAIGSGGAECCNYSNTDCNPGGGRFTARTLQVQSPDNNAIDFVGLVSIQAGGWAEIYEESHGWPGPPNLFVIGYNVDGTVSGISRNGNGQTIRDVRFLVSADCQYDNADGQYGGDSATANAVNARMTGMVATQGDLRGIVYAGDLTQNTRRYDEFDWYTDSIAGYSRFVHDGLGNHDQATATVGQQFACAFEMDECVDPGYLQETIRNRRRATVKSTKGNPHYSWDWHDVHCVQLNLFPGDSPAPQFPDLSPHGALQYLVLDLALSVGQSNRPVVLFHHYGFDSFSTNTCASCHEEWWTAEQRLAYWNAIAPYNVVGIFCGHQHLGHSSSAWRINWLRPSGTSTGPDLIPTFVSGAALAGVFLDVTINPVGQITVLRTDQHGVVRDTACIASRNPVTIDCDYSGVSEGTYVRPHSNVVQAIDTLNHWNAACESNIRFDVRGGNYSDTFTIDKPVTIRSVSGPARLGIVP